MPEKKQEETTSAPFGFVSEISVRVSESRHVGGDLFSLTLERRVSLATGADAEGEMLALNASLTEMVSSLLDARTEAAQAAVDEGIKISMATMAAQPAVASGSASVPAPTGTTPEGMAYRDLAVTATDTVAHTVTNNGTHRALALVSPFTKFGLDAWEEPLDAAFPGWKEWPIGDKKNLASLGIVTVRIILKGDGKTPQKVWSFMR